MGRVCQQTMRQLYSWSLFVCVNKKKIEFDPIFDLMDEPKASNPEYPNEDGDDNFFLSSALFLSISAALFFITSAAFSNFDFSIISDNFSSAESILTKSSICL